MPATRPVLLLVGDDTATRSFMLPVLSAGGYEIVLASNASQARHALEHRRIDIVLTDVFMPDEDGLELLQYCRRECPALPVVVTNAIEMRNFDPLPIASQFGAAAVVQTPVSPGVLLETMRCALPRNYAAPPAVEAVL